MNLVAMVNKFCSNKAVQFPLCQLHMDTASFPLICHILLESCHNVYSTGRWYWHLVEGKAGNKSASKLTSRRLQRTNMLPEIKKFNSQIYEVLHSFSNKRKNILQAIFKIVTNKIKFSVFTWTEGARNDR